MVTTPGLTTAARGDRCSTYGNLHVKNAEEAQIERILDVMSLLSRYDSNFDMPTPDQVRSALLDTSAEEAARMIAVGMDWNLKTSRGGTLMDSILEHLARETDSESIEKTQALIGLLVKKGAKPWCKDQGLLRRAKEVFEGASLDPSFLDELGSASSGSRLSVSQVGLERRPSRRSWLKSLVRPKD